MNDLGNLDWHNAKELPPRRTDLVVETTCGYVVVLGDEAPPKGYLRWAPVPRQFMLPMDAD